MNRPFETDFREYFPDRRANYSETFDGRGVGGRRVLITGAGGSIGSALAHRICEAEPRRLVLMDHGEQALRRLKDTLGDKLHPQSPEFVVGDVRDESLVSSVLSENAFDLILHAAAFKHVPLLESDPFSAIQNNGLATWSLAWNAAQFGVKKLLLISTDKAANPQSMLGISKRLAELAMLRWNNPKSQMCALRLGNVAGSSGSVLPAFREQIERGGPVTVTHSEVTRYFLSIAETCAAIGKLANAENVSGVFLQEMGEPVSILGIAENMIRKAKLAGANRCALRFTGLRPGDKLHEDLLSTDEMLGPEIAAGIRQVEGPVVQTEWLDEKFVELEEISSERNVTGLLDALKEIAPQYQPGIALTKMCAAAAGAGDD